MRYPKISIKTNFWKSKNIEEWMKRYDRLMWYLGIFAITNITYHIFANTEGMFIYIVNIIPFITSIVAIISYSKRNKEE